MSEFEKMTVDVIVPCFNEESSIDSFFSESEKVFGKIENYDFRYIFIDDGSIDGTLEKIKRLSKISDTYDGADKAAESDIGDADDRKADTAALTSAQIQDTHIKYISFSRNFGKEAAMYAGLKNSTGDYALIMDADLQHPPHLVKEMIDVIEQTGCDSCAARRVSRKGEPRIRSCFARTFYRIMNRYSDIEIVDGAVDFRIMNRKMVKAIVNMPESQRFSKGIFAWVGFNTQWIEFENVKRISGESKWTVWGLTKYAIGGFLDFAASPLKFTGVFGGVTSLLSLIYLIVEVVKTLIFGKDTPGYASTICLILFFGGLIIAVLSIMGEYMGRIYMESKRRPIYIEKESNIENEDKDLFI